MTMRSGSKGLFAASVLFAGLFFVLSAHVASAATTSPMRLFYYVDGPTARADLLLHPQMIDVLAPQAYEFDENAMLQGTIDPSILSFAAAHGIKVMPVVTNGDFDQVSLTAILNDQSRENIAINELVEVAKQEGYIGWQLDFEQMDSSYKDKYSSFVQQVANALHANGLELSVAVVAETSDNPADYPSGLYDNLIGAYDYSAIASSSDFVSVMSYDDPLSNGPVAPLAWMQKIISYSLTKFRPARSRSACRSIIGSGTARSENWWMSAAGAACRMPLKSRA